MLESRLYSDITAIPGVRSVMLLDAGDDSWVWIVVRRTSFRLNLQIARAWNSILDDLGNPEISIRISTETSMDPRFKPLAPEQGHA